MELWSFTPHIKLTSSMQRFDRLGDSRVLYSIEATRDFTVGEHRILKGDIGGWVESVDSVKDGSWVAKDSAVFDNSVVDGNSIVLGNSYVRATTIVGRSHIENSNLLSSNIESSIIKSSNVSESTVNDSVIDSHADIYSSVITISRISKYVTVNISDVKNTVLRNAVTLGNIEKPQHSFTLGPIGAEDSIVHLYRSREDCRSDHTLVVGCWTGTIDELMDEVNYRRNFVWSTWNDMTEDTMDKLEQQYVDLIPLLRAMKDSW